MPQRTICAISVGEVENRRLSTKTLVDLVSHSETDVIGMMRVERNTLVTVIAKQAQTLDWYGRL